MERLKRFWQRFRYVVKVNGNPYLIRYRLWKSKRLGIYLHHILLSDSDRNLHDHPFDFTTRILWGSYIEHQPYQAPRRCRMGTKLVHIATDLHSIELPKSGRTVWTLFIRGPKYREWGFQTPAGWVHEKEYHEKEKHVAP